MGLDITQHGETIEDMEAILLSTNPEAITAYADSLRVSLLRRHLSATGHPAATRRRSAAVAPDSVDTPPPDADGASDPAWEPEGKTLSGRVAYPEARPGQADGHDGPEKKALDELLVRDFVHDE